MKLYARSLITPPKSATRLREGLHPLERSLVAIVALHLIALPWMIGSSKIWAQQTSFVLAAAGFFVAAWNRKIAADPSGKTFFRVWMVSKLRRFPIFWGGLALAIYVVVQIGNPAWEYQFNETHFWMSSLPFNNFLPRSVDVPILTGGPVRALLPIGASVLLASSLWIGLTSRRSVFVLLNVVAANGLSLALLGFVQRLYSNGKILWFFPSPNPSWYVTFIYKNHTGAYFLAAFAVALGLSLHYYFKAVRRGERSGLCAFYMFMAAVIFTSTVLSYARGATILSVFLVAVYSLWFLWWFLRIDRRSRDYLPLCLGALVLASFIFIGLKSLDMSSNIAFLLRGVADGGDASFKNRIVATQAASEMLGEHWVFGVGAGSFRYIFPIYQAKYTDLGQAQGKYWEHAHNDLLQFPIEYGLVGFVIIAVFISWWLWRVFRRRFLRRPLVVCLFVYFGSMIGFARWDFPFQNQAILVTFCALMVLAVIMGELDADPELRF